MGKKDKDSVLDDYAKLKNEIIRDRVNEIFRNHPKDHIAKMEELGFEYFEDDYDDEEEIEERNARPENQRQRDLVAYFENKKKLSKKIFESYSEEKAAENPNYPLIRKYYKEANKNLKFLLLYGLDNYPGRIDLLSDLSFFHEFENILKKIRGQIYCWPLLLISQDPRGHRSLRIKLKIRKNIEIRENRLLMGQT